MMRQSRFNVLRGALMAAGLVAGAVFAPAAMADETGPQNTVFVGLAYLQNHASLPDLSGVGTFSVPPGLNLDVGNASTLGLVYVRNLPGPFSFELVLGYPPRVRTNAAGSGWGALQGVDVTDVDVYSPTAFINYHFFGDDAKWDPFVGIGLNYTRFTNVKASQALKNQYGPQTQVNLSDSWGAAAHVGLIYRFNSKWSVVGTVAMADVQSNLTSTFYAGSTSVITSQSKTHINFHPVIYTLAVGYSF